MVAEEPTVVRRVPAVLVVPVLAVAITDASVVRKVDGVPRAAARAPRTVPAWGHSVRDRVRATGNRTLLERRYVGGQEQESREEQSESHNGDGLIVIKEGRRH